ncbi:LacI family transcriptional regulator [Nocardia mexicana]|uniref:LacI family transcriptional regulator n=2 Tax=Nocardia mexicana TaxID=279262 RepID=A0A370H1S8_9NOCA|nr:LacI family transcriptional regulator [Nocardia mexicana]
MADIAAAVGRIAGRKISIPTVSRAVHLEPGVSPELRELVLRVAEEMNYIPTPESTGRVAVLTPVVDTWFYSSVVAGIETELHRAGLDLLLYCLTTADQRRQFIAGLPQRRKVDAVIVVAAPVGDTDRELLLRRGYPVVSVGARTDGLATVRFDDHEAARKAVGHLIHQGHNRIAMIRTESLEGAYWDADRDRYRGYRDQLDAAGLRFREDYVVSVRWGVDEGGLAMDRLLNVEAPLPTAVFCHSDEVAAGALRKLRHDARIPVPESLSVVAVDDHPIAEMINLTTVAQPARHQGSRAARAIIDHLTGQIPLDPTAATTLPATNLIFRGSTAPPPTESAAAPR